MVTFSATLKNFGLLFNLAYGHSADKPIVTFNQKQSGGGQRGSSLSSSSSSASSLLPVEIKLVNFYLKRIRVIPSSIFSW